MGQFKPMVKMMTDEPSVILKLKKGGGVKHKAVGGFMPMAASQPAPMGMPARGGMAPAAAPMKPSMAARRAAMNPNFMKKGGKAEKHEDAAQDRAMIKKAMAGKKFASGGEIDSAETKTTIEKGAKKFEKTKVNDGQHHDKHHGTKGIKESNAGGFKKGGKVPSIDRAIEHDGDWENRPANTAKAGKVNGTTGQVNESNAGGFKKGGAAKKHYATGGNVVDNGKAVKMPRHFVSRPVANSLQSGTFKKGGKVHHHSKGGLEFSDEDDRSNMTPKMVQDAKLRALQTKQYNKDASVPPTPMTEKQSIHSDGYRKGGKAKC